MTDRLDSDAVEMIDAMADRLAEVEMRVALLRETLTDARDELAYWTDPSDQYGSRKPVPRAVAMLTRIDETLNATREAE